MKYPKYSELLKANQENFNLSEPIYDAVVISNVIMGQFKDISEYHLRNSRVNAVVKTGEYDNLLQDAAKYKDADCIFLFYEMGNILDQYAFNDPSSLLSAEELRDKIKGELLFLFSELRNSKLVFFNLFSILPYSSHTIAPIFSDATIDELNIFVRENAPPSFQLVAQDKIYARVGLQEAFDLRFFISSKAPFKNEYFHAYSELILPAILTTLGRVKKVLVLDCDNTLWKGVVGEDGIEGIKVFREVQSLIVRQNKKGVLIAIVSKNNLEDVEKVFHSNSDMLLKPEHIVSWKVNWQDKATNIKELAGELNLGLSSFVFVDDSDFEVNLIRENLPEIHCIQVQKNYTDYVQTMMTLDSIFYKKVVSKEDLEKTAQYRTESLRKTSKVSFDNITDYLKSLNLKITFYEDQSSQISRIAQLTQKTNQFNLTTKRYTESEVQRMIESSDWKVFSFQVTDRYGDYGVTGALFAELNGREAFIDSFLLSCRILGRNLEKKIIETAMNRLKILGIERIGAEFVPTEKNSQTEDFYEEFQFVCSSKTAEKKEYFIHVENLPRQDLDYIEVINAR